jgi:hypothetical protein
MGSFFKAVKEHQMLQQQQQQQQGEVVDGGGGDIGRVIDLFGDSTCNQASRSRNTCRRDQRIEDS